MRKSKRRGVTILEYSIITALITIIAIVAITMLGKNSYTLYCNIDKNIANSSQANPNLNIIDTKNDQCASKEWYKSIGLNNNITPETVATACETHGGGGCFAHYEQIVFNGNRTAYITSLGGNPDVLIETGDNDQTIASKIENADNIAENLCQENYSNNNLIQTYCITAVTSAISAYQENTDSWDPTIGR